MKRGKQKKTNTWQSGTATKTTAKTKTARTAGTSSTATNACTSALRYDTFPHLWARQTSRTPQTTTCALHAHGWRQPQPSLSDTQTTRGDKFPRHETNNKRRKAKAPPPRETNKRSTHPHRPGTPKPDRPS